MLLHRVGERYSALDVRARRQNRLGEILVFFLIAENLEALHQRQARVDHDRELPHEDGEVLRIDLLANLALLSSRGRRSVLLRWRDPRDEHLLAPERGNGGGRGVSDALAGDTLSTRACGPNTQMSA